MSKLILVRYQARAEAADENQRLVEGVLAELAAEDPGRLRYAAFRLADGVNFVHIVDYEGDDDPLARSAAFAEFQRGIGDRLAGPTDARRGVPDRFLPLSRQEIHTLTLTKGRNSPCHSSLSKPRSVFTRTRSRS